MWTHMNGYGWDSGGMGLGMLLFWGLLIAFIVIVLRCISGSGSCSRNEQGKSALDLLNERYARGEIGKEEFEQKKRDIEG